MELHPTVGVSALPNPHANADIADGAPEVAFPCCCKLIPTAGFSAPPNPHADAADIAARRPPPKAPVSFYSFPRTASITSTAISSGEVSAPGGFIASYIHFMEKVIPLPAALLVGLIAEKSDEIFDNRTVQLWAFIACYTLFSLLASNFKGSKPPPEEAEEALATHYEKVVKLKKNLLFCSGILTVVSMLSILISYTKGRSTAALHFFASIFAFITVFVVAHALLNRKTVWRLVSRSVVTIGGEILVFLNLDVSSEEEEDEEEKEKKKEEEEKKKKEGEEKKKKEEEEEEEEEDEEGDLENQRSMRRRTRHP